MKTAVTLFISILVSLFCSTTSFAQKADTQQSFQFEHTPLRATLDSLMRWYSPSIVYLDKDVEGKFVSGSCSTNNFAQALNMVLNGTSLTWVQTGNQVIVKPQESQKSKRTTTISGTLTDSLTGDWITGATVYIQTDDASQQKTVRHWCFSNAFGFFSLPRVPLGTYQLIVRTLGYETLTQSITIASEESMQFNFCMMQKDIVTREVIVEGTQTALSAVNGISHGIYLPSVPTDQNQYLLDGGHIYNPSHVGGVLSTFNTAALNDVSISLGGMPPDYGGRIGGILDLSMREGNRQTISGSVGTGSLMSNILLEGPIIGGNTFLIAGRTSYPDNAVQLFHPESSPLHVGYSELTAKAANRLNSNQQISLSGYFSADSYSNTVLDTAEKLNNDFSWKNAMFAFRWIGIVSPSLFLHSSLVYSRYGMTLHHDLMNALPPYSSVPRSSDYSIEDVSAQACAEAYYDESHTVRAGVDLVHHGINANISEFSSQTATLSLKNYSAWDASFYLQDQWKLFPGVSVDLGARATSFLGDQGSFSAIDPRFSLLVSINDATHLYSSFSTVNQFLHPYRNSGVFLLYPTTFWYPSTDAIHPTTSLHIALGVERAMHNDTYVASIESYYRVTNDLHEFNLDTTTTASEDLSSTILFGTGKTYGFVCNIKKRVGDFTGSISYNLSWAYETFAKLNNGNEFSPPFDRRHEVQLTSRCQINENWTAGILCVYTSLQSSSVMQTYIQSAASSVKLSTTTGSGFGDLIDINGSRLPGFQRLELNITRQLVLFKLPSQFSLRLLNSYGLIDPFEWTLQRSNYAALKWNANLRQINLFPLYPVIDFSMGF